MLSDLIQLLTQTEFSWAANHTIVEFLAGYVFAAALIVGAPAVFFFIAFMPALQNTKGRMVGYKDHKTYGDSSIYENTPSDNSKAYLALRG
jgi:hypothetical protein|tara:strand:- start:150 stop:422 length:273 start_codon:yes stop_codon:yes gene_type:complete